MSRPPCAPGSQRRRRIVGWTRSETACDPWRSAGCWSRRCRRFIQYGATDCGAEGKEDGLGETIEDAVELLGRIDLVGPAQPQPW